MRRIVSLWNHLKDSSLSPTEVALIVLAATGLYAIAVTGTLQYRAYELASRARAYAATLENLEHRKDTLYREYLARIKEALAKHERKSGRSEMTRCYQVSEKDIATLASILAVTSQAMQARKAALIAESRKSRTDMELIQKYLKGLETDEKELRSAQYFLMSIQEKVGQTVCKHFMPAGIPT